MLLVDWQIRHLCIPDEGGLYDFDNPVGQHHEFEHPMIEPFSENVSGNGVISYGLDHAGYCLRLAPEILVFKSTYGEIIDPKFFADPEYRKRVFEERLEEKNFVLPAGCYVLGRSHEYLRIPRFLKGRCVGKSTLARAGILINTTPLEPEWEGHLTIEIGNVSGAPVRIHVMEGIAQLEFEQLSAKPQVSYKDKGGIYQGQTGVTPPRVRE